MNNTDYTEHKAKIISDHTPINYKKIYKKLTPIILIIPLIILGFYFKSDLLRFITSFQKTTPHVTPPTPEVTEELTEEQIATITEDYTQSIMYESPPYIADLPKADITPRDIVPSGNIFFTAQHNYDTRNRAYKLPIINGKFTRETVFNNDFFMLSFPDPTYPYNYLAIGYDPEDIDGYAVYDVEQVDEEPYTVINSVSTNSLREDNITAAKNLIAMQRLIKQPTNTAEAAEIQYWGIVLYDTETELTILKIDNAIQPQLSKDASTLYYLKERGLYAYDIHTQTEQWLIPIHAGGKIITSSMLDLSPNNEFLIWTTAKAGQIDIFKFEDRFTLSHVNRVDAERTGFYWPIFAPDNYHYAIQATDILPEEEVIESENMRLEIRTILDDTPVLTYSLANNFVPYHTFNDDWTTAE